MALVSGEWIPLQDLKNRPGTSRDVCSTVEDLRRLVTPSQEEEGKNVIFEQPAPGRPGRCYPVSRRTQAMAGAGTLVIALTMLALIFAAVHSERIGKRGAVAPVVEYAEPEYEPAMYATTYNSPTRPCVQRHR